MKKIQLNKQTLTSLIFLCLTIVFHLFLLNISMNLRIKLTISLAYITLVYIYIIKTTIKYKGINNVFIIFIFFTILFYYGQHILAVFSPEYFFKNQDYHILDGRINDNAIISATFLIIECLLLIFTGYFFNNKQKKEQESIQTNDAQLIALRRIAWIFLIISIYPTIKYLLAQYRLSNLYGYLGRRSLEQKDNYYSILGVSILEIYISDWFLISVYALLISYKNKKMKFIAYILVIIYCIMYYITGSRFMILKLLVTIYLINSIWISQPKKKNIIKIAIIGIIFVLFMGLGTLWRGKGFENFSFKSLMNELDLGGLLWEPGITFTTVSNILVCCPKYVDYFYGKSYIGAILMCLPNILRFGFFDNNTLHLSSIFSKFYYGNTNFGYGSSFIAEAYFNLGILIYPAMFLFGILIRKLDNSLIKAAKEKSAFVFLILVKVSGDIAFAVRNDLSALPRDILFSVIPIILCAIIYKLSLIRLKK